jgi:hypothetical protein
VRQLGVRMSIILVIALVATVGVLGSPADARSHRHHRHHHRGGGGVTPPPATPASGPCAAAPSTALLNLAGSVVFSIQCHGLSPAEPLGIDSFLIRGNCLGATNFPIAGTADLNGNATFPVFGFNCLPGTYSIQLVGSFTNAEFPVTFTF